MMATRGERVAGVAQGVHAGDKAIYIPVHEEVLIPNLQELQDSAMKSATDLRHQMTAFQGLYEQPLIAESICEKCEAYMQVNANPEARVAIGGTAIIYNCSE